MKKFLGIIAALVFMHSTKAQSPSAYTDSINKYIADYIDHHEVVKGADRKLIHFFSPDESFKVLAHVELQPESEWFNMNTSGTVKKQYRVYALLHFSIHDTTMTMQLLQSRQLLGSPQYADYLFLPFTDKTTGETTYESGRYIDLRLSDLNKEHTVWIDFNKAYNPYCAYSSGYNCPIPPRENDLPVAIFAGEKKYGDSQH